jgi:arginyl-tRNA synthetase
MVTDELEAIVAAALERAASDGILDPDSLPTPSFERPRKREHGDWATNVALAAAKGQGKPPCDIATALIERLPPSDLIEGVEIAGPGFLNFRLSPVWLHDVVRRASDAASGFGRSKHGNGVKMNVEYVSANPTGPVNVVSGRHAAVGDAISNLLEATGHAVTREFYANDHGRQADLFGESIAARYLQHLGVQAELPEDGYQGEYVAEIAKEIAERDGDRYLNLDPGERNAALRDIGLQMMLQAMRESLQRFGTRFDVWFSERTLHEKGEVSAAIERLRAKGLIEERDGATWFLSTRFGDDKDRVVIRASGEPTYLAGDIAYLHDKFERGFDGLIYLWGADHHGSIVRLLGAAEALGYDRSAVEIHILQIVTLVAGGESVKSSKRAGAIVPLDDLVREVGADAARYTFLTRSMEAPLEFDIDLAKERANENPVYYVQYAHARICSILRKADEEGHAANVAADMSRITHPSEDALMRKLASYEELLPEASRARSPQKVTRFVEELAATFTAFYRDCKVITNDAGLTSARLLLCVATKNVIADALGLLGVGAPERM